MGDKNTAGTKADFTLPLRILTSLTRNNIDTILPQCVVPENIHTLPMEGIGISRGWGGSKAQEKP